MANKILACSGCFLSLRVQEFLDVNGAQAQATQAAGLYPQHPPAGDSPCFAFTEPSRVLRASARWPAMPRKARRSSPRATLQHDTANKGVFLSCLGAGTQLLPFKGSNCFHKRQPDQQSPFASVCEPSLDVFSSSEPFVHPLFILGSPKAV